MVSNQENDKTKAAKDVNGKSCILWPFSRLGVTGYWARMGRVDRTQS